VLHALFNGKKVYLEIQGRQRWKCKHCGRTSDLPRFDGHPTNWRYNLKRERCF
jgi:transposase-like protein